jgi:hypothetical protein
MTGQKAKIMRAIIISVAALITVAVLGVAPAFALTIIQDANIAAGQAAFGPTVTLFNWADFFPAGMTWTFGSLPPDITFGLNVARADPLTGNTVAGTPISGVHLGTGSTETGSIPMASDSMIPRALRLPI